MNNIPHVSRKCLTCGKIFYTFNYQIKVGKGKYCSNKCYGKSLIGKPSKSPTRFIKGMTPWNKGIKGKDSHFYGNKFALGNKMTLEQRKHLSDGHKAVREKNHLWKGGINPINKAIRGSFEYRNWRRSIFKRDNFTCQICGHVGGLLNADHIKPFSEFPKLRFIISNGRTLCYNCHRKTDTFGWKIRKYAISNNQKEREVCSKKT